MTQADIIGSNSTAALAFQDERAVGESLAALRAKAKSWRRPSICPTAALRPLHEPATRRRSPAGPSGSRGLPVRR